MLPSDTHPQMEDTITLPNHRQHLNFNTDSSNQGMEK